ncbi:MAG: hypothetical protein H8D65_02210 [Spirochaetes bacterium]|nr:hypothetical protein [Spirochaetota bacterium]
MILFITKIEEQSGDNRTGGCFYVCKNGEIKKMRDAELLSDTLSSRYKNISTKKLTALLISRLLLFAFFQAIIALVLKSWNESEKYWMLSATLGNIVSIIFLSALCKIEGNKYLNLLKFDRARWKKDLPLFSGLTLLIVPIAMGPNYLLSIWLWGDFSYSYELLFRSIPHQITFILLIAFPVTIAFAELPTYFGYIMPRLQKSLKNKWLGMLLPVLFLSIQHCCLPLIFEFRFILFRGLVFLPFALLLGITLWKRPRLLPYFMILHGLMDMQTVIMLIIKPAN